jgi:hypothetical protein
MRNKLSFRIAYTLVTAAFTSGLLFLLISVIGVIVGGGGTISWDEIELKVSGRSSNKWITAIVEETGKTKPYDEYVLNEKGDTVGSNSGLREILDTLKVFKEKDFGEHIEDPTIRLPLAYFKKSRTINYILLQSRVFLLVLLWEYILYQLFLILYDLKNEIFFIRSNTRRMRRIGYAFIFMCLLDFKYHYNVFLSPKNELVIHGGSVVNFYTGNFFLFLTIASIVFVLSWVFNQGSQLKQENDLTV